MAVVPIGTIIAFGGEIVNIPEGYLVCDGHEYAESAQPTLFNAIQRAWGGDANRHTFKVPDLRGLFLRGVNDTKGGAFIDPEAAQRVAQNGGNEGNRVGSVQADTLQHHAHSFVASHPAPQLVLEQGDNASWYPESAGSTGDFGGVETRPKNAYVYYLIAAR